jgi:hypothetical protein
VRDTPVRRTHPLSGFDPETASGISSSPFIFAAELLLLRLPPRDAVLLVLTDERHHQIRDHQIRHHQVSLAPLVLLLTAIDAVHADLKINLLG